MPSSVMPGADHVIFEMQRTMGKEAGESCALILRRGGRAPLFNSLSYLQRIFSEFRWFIGADCYL